MDEAVILKQKKRKIAIDPDQDDEELVNTVTTKTVEEPIERPKHDHKNNGDKAPDAKKNPEKKEEKKVQKSDAKDTSQKPKAPVEKEKIAKSNENKSEAKPKTSSTINDKKEMNGQQKPSQTEKKAPVKSPQKQVSKKRKEESDSEESEESESEEEEVKPKKKKSSTPTKKKETPKKEKKQMEKKDRTPKEELIYDVLKRWWYAMPDWPPANYDYNPELTKHNLKKVEQKFLRQGTDSDEKGVKRVYEVPSYPGVFKDAKGEIIDLRPKENCPSYDNLKTKNPGELFELLIKACKGQLEALQKSQHVDKDILKDVQKTLSKAEKSLEAYLKKKSK